MKLSQIAEDINYIKLESNKKCYIKRIDKYSISDDYILIYDRNQGRILLFNHQGSFIRSISQNGSGPGEFVWPIDVRISRNKKFVLIHDQKKVTRFGFDEKLIGETQLPSGARYIDTFDNGLIGFLTWRYSQRMDNYSIAFFDWDGKITGQLMKRNWDRKQSGSRVRKSMFYYLNNELRINEGYYDTVYAITPNRSLEPRIGIIHNYKYDPYEKYDPDERMHPMCLDKETGKVYHFPYNKEFNTHGIPNDLDGGAPFWPSIYQDDKVYSFQYSHKLKSILDNELIDDSDFKSQILRDKLIRFKENLTEEDGPVLIEIILK